MGIALGRVDVLVEVQELQGRQFVPNPSGGKGAVAVVKRFMTETSVFAHQTVVKVSGKEVRRLGGEWSYVVILIFVCVLHTYSEPSP